MTTIRAGRFVGNPQYRFICDDTVPQVRRVAVKCIGTIIVTRPTLFIELFETLSPRLIAQFRGVHHACSTLHFIPQEREENVRIDIVLAYCTLLHQFKNLYAATEQSAAHLASVYIPTLCSRHPS